MASMNKVFLLGRLGKDPELRTTQSGQTVCHFSMATDESYTGRDGNVQKKTTWHSVVVWGKQSDPCSRFLRKGSTALVEGAIDVRDYEDRDGNKRKSFEIKAMRVQFLDKREDGDRDDDRRDRRDERRDVRRDDSRRDDRRDDRRGGSEDFDDVPF